MLEKIEPPDLTKPSLEGLAWLLRHRDQWPAGFKHYFWCQPSQCAMGLAAAQWNLDECSSYNMATHFGLSSQESYELFHTWPGGDSAKDMALYIDNYRACLAAPDLEST